MGVPDGHEALDYDLGKLDGIIEPMTRFADPVDAVLFDLDGTLVETNIDFPLMKREMLALAAEHGLDSVDLASMDILAIVDTIAESLASCDRQEEARNVRVRAMRILEEIELRHAHETEEIPFARELVTRLSECGVRVGIVTRNCRSASMISLGIVGITPAVLVCREDSERHKPHPDPLMLALTTLAASASASVMVGDHLMDVQSGKAAGMGTIGFLRDSRPPDFFDQVRPDLVVRDLREALRAIVGSDS